ncbi:hypothetical protein RCL1_006551 [Eukaryota sp. TZLM3-RCL]
MTRKRRLLRFLLSYLMSIRRSENQLYQNSLNQILSLPHLTNISTTQSEILELISQDPLCQIEAFRDSNSYGAPCLRLKWLYSPERLNITDLSPSFTTLFLPLPVDLYQHLLSSHSSPSASLHSKPSLPFLLFSPLVFQSLITDDWYFNYFVITHYARIETCKINGKLRRISSAIFYIDSLDYSCITDLDSIKPGITARPLSAISSGTSSNLTDCNIFSTPLIPPSRALSSLSMRPTSGRLTSLDSTSSLSALQYVSIFAALNTPTPELKKLINSKGKINVCDLHVFFSSYCESYVFASCLLADPLNRFTVKVDTDIDSQIFDSNVLIGSVVSDRLSCIVDDFSGPLVGIGQKCDDCFELPFGLVVAASKISLLQSSSVNFLITAASNQSNLIAFVKTSLLNKFDFYLRKVADFLYIIEKRNEEIATTIPMSLISRSYPVKEFQLNLTERSNQSFSMSSFNPKRPFSAITTRDCRPLSSFSQSTTRPFSALSTRTCSFCLCPKFQHISDEIFNGKTVLFTAPPGFGKSKLCKNLGKIFGRSNLIDLDSLLDLGSNFRPGISFEQVLMTNAEKLVSQFNNMTKNFTKFWIGFLPDLKFYNNLNNVLIVVLDSSSQELDVSRQSKFDGCDRDFDPRFIVEYVSIQKKAEIILKELQNNGAIKVPLCPYFLKLIFNVQANSIEKLTVNELLRLAHCL